MYICKCMCICIYIYIYTIIYIIKLVAEIQHDIPMSNKRASFPRQLKIPCGVEWLCSVLEGAGCSRGQAETTYIYIYMYTYSNI